MRADQTLTTWPSANLGSSLNLQAPIFLAKGHESFHQSEKLQSGKVCGLIEGGYGRKCISLKCFTRGQRENPANPLPRTVKHYDMPAVLFHVSPYQSVSTVGKMAPVLRIFQYPCPRAISVQEQALPTLATFLTQQVDFHDLFFFDRHNRRSIVRPVVE